MAAKSGAGQLNERLSAEKRTEMDDGAGNTVSGPYEAQFQRAARLMPLRGGETVLASRLTGTQPYICTIRNSIAARQIAPEWQLRDTRRGVVYQVKTAVLRESRDFIDCMVVSGVAG